jgi:heat shock protein HslJ
MKRVALLPVALIVAGCSTQPAAPASDLLDRYWRVAQIDGQAVTRRPGTREPHIVLRREGSRISGFAGCNSLGGTFQQDGAALRFGDKLAMTRMACVGEGDALEAAFTKALLSTSSYSVVADKLELRDAQGAARMILETGKDSYR